MTAKINPILFFAQVVLLSSGVPVDEVFFPDAWDTASVHQQGESGMCKVFPHAWHELYISAAVVKAPQTSTSAEGAVSSKVDVRYSCSGLDATGMTGTINPILFFALVVLLGSAAPVDDVIFPDA